MRIGEAPDTRGFFFVDMYFGPPNSPPKSDLLALPVGPFSGCQMA